MIRNLWLMINVGIEKRLCHILKKSVMMDKEECSASPSNIGKETKPALKQIPDDLFTLAAKDDKILHSVCKDIRSAFRQRARELKNAKHKSAPCLFLSSSSKLQPTRSTKSQYDVDDEISIVDEIPSKKIQRLDRQWLQLKPHKSNNSFSNTSNFRLCSYNVLCQDTMATTAYLYTTCKPCHLKWEHRWSCLKTEFGSIDADIYCLQEVNAMFYMSHFKPYFEQQEFDCIMKKKTGGKPDGCAIFWRRSKFSAETIDSVEYRVPHTILDRDNVGLVTVLNFRDQPSKKVIVATTHLLFNPARGDIKLCQLAMLLSRVKKLAFKRSLMPGLVEYFPSIVCGDFNATPYSSLYNFMTQGFLFYHGLPRSEITGQGKKGGPALKAPLLPTATWVTESCQLIEKQQQVEKTLEVQSATNGSLSHDLKFKSTYKHVNGRGKAEITTYHSNESACVDYIFYSTGALSEDQDARLYQTDSEPDSTLRCSRIYSLPDINDLNLSTGKLPCHTEGSDHVSLAADFEL